MATISANRRDAFGEYFWRAHHDVGGFDDVVCAAVVAAQCAAVRVDAEFACGAMGGLDGGAAVCGGGGVGVACATHGVAVGAVGVVLEGRGGAVGGAGVVLCFAGGGFVGPVFCVVIELLVVIRCGGLAGVGVFTFGRPRTRSACVSSWKRRTGSSIADAR